MKCKNLYRRTIERFYPMQSRQKTVRRRKRKKFQFKEDCNISKENKNNKKMSNPTLNHHFKSRTFTKKMKWILKTMTNWNN
jgi:hypothetical protein